MKQLPAILAIVALFLLSFSSFADPWLVLIKNNTASNLQFVNAKADAIPSNYKEYKVSSDIGQYSLFGVAFAPGYFEIAPNELKAVYFGNTVPLSIKQSTGISWKNLDDLGSPPFSRQFRLETEQKNHPAQMPMIVIGTKNIGLSWDINLEWIPDAEAKQIANLKS